MLSKITRPIREEKNLKGKRILLRTDFNVPMENGVILDDYKIKESLLTIFFLLHEQAKVIIISHSDEESLKPCAILLSKLIGKSVKFLHEYKGFDVEEIISKMQNGEIIMLENLRLNTGEEKNDSIFAKDLARLGDIYVNDAFAACHRNHASLSAIKKFIPAYGGLLLEKELGSLSKIIYSTKPFTTIFGGAKLETKLPIVEKIYDQADYILLGGLMASFFLKSINMPCGILPEIKNLKLVSKILKNHKKILTPIDVIVENNKGKTSFKKILEVKETDKIMDIGPDTLRLYCGIIKKSQTILWNGPMGKFEDKKYRHGTMILARAIAARSDGKAFGIVGGGETIEALKLTKMESHIDWISTGGGAMLVLLAGEKMPGLEGIAS